MTALSLTSSPGDDIGRGQSLRFTSGVRVLNDHLGYIAALGGGTPGWVVELAPARGRALHPGRYVDATWPSPASSATPAINVYGDGRMCEHTYGSFTIISIEMTPSGAVKEFSADFEQHCESPTAPPLTGRIRYGAPPSAPVVLTSEQPTGLGGMPVRLNVHVAASSVGVATGTVAFYDGRTLLGTKPLADGRADLNPSGLAVGSHQITAVYSGDAHLPPAASDPFTEKIVDGSTSLAFTGGSPRFWVAPSAAFSVSGTRAYLTVAMTKGNGWYRVELAAAPGKLLTTGHYADAERASSRDPGHPGLDVYGNGFGCNTVQGSFDVATIGVHGDGSISHLDATFTEYCEGNGVPVFQGRVRYQA